MAKRLYMSSADYLAIAVSPALIMLLVGSLVFFLLEVVYVGEYQARLNYVFALFVFATVLVGRISIEMGSERAAMYSIPLALATFVVLQKFVEHPSVFSPLINIVLIAVVWWCAHRLTWDCTLIDDSVDASGEGLMQLAGVDDTEDDAALTPQRNQLLPGESLPNFWQRMFSFETGPHAPGLWVLYFSLAALPIFGIGQGFIPASDTASRRYVFVLLFVYVASGLLLLVTTSFLGFRRYLRQRGVDMPTPMAVTWVAVGAVVTAIVLLVTTLLPRPSAEFSLAQAPWQASSPEGLTSSQYGRGSDGAVGEEPSTESATTTDENAPTGDTTSEDQTGRPPGDASEEGTQQSDSGDHSNPGDSGEPGEEGESREQSGESQSSQSDQQASPGDEASKPSEENRSGERTSQSSEQQENSEPSQAADGSSESPDSEGTQPSEQQSVQPPQHSPQPPTSVVETMSNIAGGIAGLIKWLFYLVLALVCAFLLWKYRHELLAAARDMWRDLKAFLARLFGRETTAAAGSEAALTAPLVPRKRFRDFRNPFAGDAYRKVPPAELVRYTFEAFEAWAADRGQPRRADQTPLEFVESVAAEQVANEQAMRTLCRLYGRVAYGDGGTSPSDLPVLQEVWRWMSDSSVVLARSE